MDKISFLTTLVAISLIFTGCMTPVTVTTDPPGATVYCRGAGRPAYKWQPRGQTAKDAPVVFRVPYNAVRTFVQWPSEGGKPGVRSEEVYTKLLFKDDAVLHFKR